MVKGKTEMTRIENATRRRVSFSKRKNSLLRKAAYELSEAQVAVIVFSPTGKLYESSSSSTSMQKTIERYHKYNKDVQVNNSKEIDHQNSHQWENEIANLTKMIENLEASKRNLMGEDLESCSIDELETAENQLEKSLLNIRGKKNELFGEKIEQLKQKEKQLLEMNADLSEKCWASTTGTTEPTEKKIIPHETSSNSQEVESELQIVRPEGR
ncbi:hypothetical protein MKX03_034400 [Papaver bracteatum]|nr:hypothetical protein MKX03_034400 [Papaver bracteatum]